MSEDAAFGTLLIEWRGFIANCARKIKSRVPWNAMEAEDLVVTGELALFEHMSGIDPRPRHSYIVAQMWAEVRRFDPWGRTDVEMVPLVEDAIARAVADPIVESSRCGDQRVTIADLLRRKLDERRAASMV